MKPNRLKMNLQIFNDGNPGGSGTPEAITFDNQSELDSYLDKHASKALSTARAKWESEVATKLEEAKTEAEKMAKMTADEKAKVEADKQADVLAKREADITRRELRAQAIEQLAEKGLPSDLIGAVVLNDADACNQSIEVIETSFRSAVEKGVNERLKGSASNPPIGTGTVKGSSGPSLEKMNEFRITK